MLLSHLILKRRIIKLHSPYKFSPLFSSLSTAATDSSSPSTPKPTSLSERMSFIFEQIDEIDKQRQEKDQTLQRIRTWRESKQQQQQQDNHHLISDSAQNSPELEAPLEKLESELSKSEAFTANIDRREVEFAHPWPEWIELMERLLQQNYFDHRRKDEEGMMKGLGLDLSNAGFEEGKKMDFARDYRTVQAAMVQFGKDRFDILRSLSRQDIQLLVGYGCPSTDKKAVFSSKLLRKRVHLDEGDVCSSCNLRSSCERGYLLTNKEDEARTIDIMRVLLTYGFDPIEGTVENKSLLKLKSTKTVVRKLLHDVVKLSAVPIDPNLPPPIIKKPPPKVKIPPPPPRKRVGRNDIEMKKGDWLCPKCDFMNFAKNTVCMQCDAKRPKRQLLPGEWECPQCNFLNYRRNTVCFHCEHNRPPDTYGESQFPDRQRGPTGLRTDKRDVRTEVSNAWNFDFDDNESDGADVAAFEYADSRKLDEASRTNENGPERRRNKDVYERRSKGFERDNSIGFNDFDEDDDDVDSYDVVAQSEVPEASRIGLSDLESDSESEKERVGGNLRARGRVHGKKPDSDDDGVDFDSDDDFPVHPNWKSSHVANPKQSSRGRGSIKFCSDDDDESEFSSGTDDESLRSRNKGNNWGSNNSARGGSYKKKAFSDDLSDDDFGGRGEKPRGRMGMDSARKAPRGRGGNFGRERSGSNRGYEKRDVREDSFAGKPRDGHFSKSRNERQRGSFDKRGGRSNNFDDKADGYLNDERYSRPRVNVR